MIPGGASIIGGYRFVARRHGWRADAFDAEQIQAALTEATELAAGEERDEPAALFYALARRPEAFPDGWRTMAASLARAHAGRIRARFAPYPGALDSFCTKVSAGEASYAAVRDWFREMMGR